MMQGRINGGVKAYRFFKIAVSASVIIAGFVTPAISAGDTVTYEYDELGRLIKVDRGGAKWPTYYTYDETGNRESVIQALLVNTTFNISDVFVSEGGTLSFIITRSGDLTGANAVTYATADGTAGSGDYTSTSGTASFAIDDETKTINVTTTQESIAEDNETVLLNLTAPTNLAVIIDNQGVGVIEDDDGTPGFPDP
jgi:Calx-beta domain-containing protein